MKTLIKNIKILSEGQKALKNQRKTINLIGDRTMQPWVACYKHSANKTTLRIMNVALGLLKGRDLKEIESNPKTLVDMVEVKKIMDSCEILTHEN